MYLGKSADNWQAEQRFREFKESIIEHAPKRYKFFAGVDIGKRQDASVICIIEQEIDVETGNKTNVVKRLQKLPAQTNYVEQASIIKESFAKNIFALWPIEIYLDISGVGDVIGDNLEASGLKFKRVVITSGDAITYKDKRLRVSRSRLFQTIRKHFHAHDFSISADLIHAEELKAELHSISENYGSNGAAYYEASGHDDFTVALGLALLAMDRRGRVTTGVCPLF